MKTLTLPRLSALILVLALIAVLATGSLATLANAVSNDSADSGLQVTTPYPPDPVAPTYVYISCPIELSRGTPDAYEPAEYLVDDFAELPEHWLYVLTPLASDETYQLSLDLACRTQNTRFEGSITATYQNYIPDDGSLGTFRVEATEEVSPGVFVVYYGELKYISDGTLYLSQANSGIFSDHHLFSFDLITPDFDPESLPLGEQNATRLTGPAIDTQVTITSSSDGLSDVYTENLLESPYMYPYHQYQT